MPADDADDSKKQDGGDGEAPPSHQKFDPPTESKFKIPIESRRPARGLPPAEREELAKARASQPGAPPSQRTTLRPGPPTRGPTRRALSLLGALVLLGTGIAAWGTWRESKPSPNPQGSEAAVSTTSGPAPANLLANSKPAVTPHPPAQVPETTAACSCLSDASLGPAPRAKCLEQLRDDESLEAAACLRRFVDEHSKSADKAKSKNPTPEQQLVLDAANALYTRANPGLPRVLPAKPPPVGPQEPPRSP